MKRTIGIKVQIKEAREIGTKICKAELDSAYEKEMVMKNKNKLDVYKRQAKRKLNQFRIWKIKGQIVMFYCLFQHLSLIHI